MAVTSMQLYEYAIYYVPEDEEGNIKRAECKILVEPKTMLATGDNPVTLQAAKEIPDEVDLDFVRVVVRPF